MDNTVNALYFFHINKGENHTMTESIDKIALFDFCETLTNYQTADAYVKYVIKHNKANANAILWGALSFFLGNKIMAHFLYKYCHISFNKYMLLKQIKGITFEKMDYLAQMYYIEVVKPNLIPETIEALKKCIKYGYRIAVVSAGYGIYIKYFAEEYGVNDTICTELLFEQGRFCGKYIEPDCVRENKVKRLQQFYGVKDFRNIDSISFSDSISDLPMLNFTKRKVIVCKTKPYWMTDEMELLRWNNE